MYGATQLQHTHVVWISATHRIKVFVVAFSTFRYVVVVVVVVTTASVSTSAQVIRI